MRQGMTVLVETTNGTLAGEERAGIRRFLGVPFAAAPIGGRRFLAPAPVAPWAGVRDATRYGASAMQGQGMLRDVPPSAEDCLSLNVWTPGLDGAKRPVMVWIHGGGFTTGSGGQGMYEGSRLARVGDAVVVTLNYRLGVLGFLYLEQLLAGDERVRDSANPGLRDQLAALRWVRDNIESFGGDPANVTVFGESAGAMSLSTLLATPAARGLFHRAIAQSGAAEHVLPAADATEVAHTLLTALGGSARHPDVLWEAPIDAIMAAQAACVRQRVRRGYPGAYQTVAQMGTGMVADGNLVPCDVRAAILEGNLPVPLLVGSNADEWHFYVQLSDRGKLTLDEAGLHKVLESRAPSVGARAIAHYRGLPRYRDLAPWEVFSAIEGDRNFRMPGVRLAEYQQRHAPVYAYHFDRPSPLIDGQLGACHSIELSYVFGALDTEFGRSFCGFDARGEALSLAMMHAWANFARSGEPGSVQGHAWAPYDLTRRSTMRLGDRVELLSDPLAGEREFWAAEMPTPSVV